MFVQHLGNDCATSQQVDA